MKYNKPEITITKFDVEDIITLSTSDGTSDASNEFGKTSLNVNYSKY